MVRLQRRHDVDVFFVHPHIDLLVRVRAHDCKEDQRAERPDQSPDLLLLSVEFHRESLAELVKCEDFLCYLADNCFSFFWTLLACRLHAAVLIVSQLIARTLFLIN